jgi:hypothetical protein
VRAIERQGGARSRHAARHPHDPAPATCYCPTRCESTVCFAGAGVEADLQVYEGLSHAQYLFDPTLTVPREVFGEIARFFDAHLIDCIPSIAYPAHNGLRMGHGHEMN